jgi:protein-tyrosine phosphatase
VAVSVLMVCLGNICRSPLAEAALRHHAERQGVELHIESAGTGDWHVGHPPDHRAQAVAKRLGGIDISNLRARQLHRADFDCFDHIVVMDQSNLRNVKAMQPHGSVVMLSMLLDHLPGHEGQPVPDPYYGDDAGFDHVWQLVDAAAMAFVERLKAESGFT